MAGKSMMNARVDYSEINSAYTGMKYNGGYHKSEMNHKLSDSMSSHDSYKSKSTQEKES